MMIEIKFVTVYKNFKISQYLENWCSHIWEGWETHVKDEIAPQQLTSADFLNRLQLTAEENLGS